MQFWVQNIQELCLAYISMLRYIFSMANKYPSCLWSESYHGTAAEWVSHVLPISSLTSRFSLSAFLIKQSSANQLQPCMTQIRKTSKPGSPFSTKRSNLHRTYAFMIHIPEFTLCQSHYQRSGLCHARQAAASGPSPLRQAVWTVSSTDPSSVSFGFSERWLGKLVRIG